MVQVVYVAQVVQVVKVVSLDDMHSESRSWQFFGEGKNGHRIYRQAINASFLRVIANLQV